MLFSLREIKTREPCKTTSLELSELETAFDVFKSSTGGFLTLVEFSETLKQRYLLEKFERAEKTPLR